MSRDDDIGKTLGTWLGKVKKIAVPPGANETKGHRQEPERSLSHHGHEDTHAAQLQNSASKKKHIKQLAVRDNITLLTMLNEMVELYEKEHGKLDRK